MDSFQGSSPRKFVSFYLENPREENQQTSDPTFVQDPAENSNTNPELKNQTEQQTSSKEDGSDEDVNEYADNVVRLKEGSTASGIEQTENMRAQTQQILERASVDLEKASQVRTSTPIPVSQGEAHSTSLTSLESALMVTATTEFSEPELVPVTTPLVREHSETQLSAGEDTSSSIYEVPALPGLTTQGVLPTEPSEAEKTEDEISRLGYHHTQNVTLGDTESGTEGGDESGPGTETVLRVEPGTSGHITGVPVQELSGRSKAILKQFFDETPPFSLPIGHPTVAFSEPQLYHLLKTLTNETLSQSFTTMEKMVLGAVRGAPTTAQSRTGHFRSRQRAQTSHPRMDSDTSEAGTESHLYSGPPIPGFSGASTGEDMTTNYEEPDSAAEMALIADHDAESPGTPPLPQGSQLSPLKLELPVK